MSGNYQTNEDDPSLLSNYKDQNLLVSRKNTTIMEGDAEAMRINVSNSTLILDTQILNSKNSLTIVSPRYKYSSKSKLLAEEARTSIN
jgi:hypothetical protein